MKRILNRLYYAFKFWINLERKIAEEKILSSQILIRKNNKLEKINSLEDIEFKVFSQLGEDGIIQYLINKLDIRAKSFVEFGVEDYKEANTRFLLMNNNWSGLVMDGSKKHIRTIQNDFPYLFHALVARQHFITKENINQLIESYGFAGELGILSIDIDGNDYWVWKEISVVNPAIVVMEYNALFGKERAITTPYQADFFRTKAHHSNLYFGASLKALCILAEEKGYDFIGCNSGGSNAFFVRKDILAKTSAIKATTCEEGFVMSKFRQGRDKKGKLLFASNQEEIAMIRGLEVWNIEKQESEKF